MEIFILLTICDCVFTRLVYLYIKSFIFYTHWVLEREKVFSSSHKISLLMFNYVKMDGLIFF